MDALLAAMTRAERRPGVVARDRRRRDRRAAAALYLALGRGSAQPAAASARILDPADVWSPQQAAAFAQAEQPLAAAALDAEFSRWQGRARACVRRVRVARRGSAASTACSRGSPSSPQRSRP